jgi:DNA repair photolyase
MNGSCRIAEIECKSILNKSALADYTVNCYTGCEHGCVYCYARFVTRFTHPGEPWGSFVDVKINAPEALKRELRRKKVGRVYISSVCDGWQPLEAKYELTRSCLELLLHYRYPVTILTKSGLAARDLDLLPGGEDVELGVTLTTLDESLRAKIEPRASAAEKRISLLHDARERGITTYAFLGPFMPRLSDGEDNLGTMLQLISEAGVAYFYVDRLNPRPRVWSSLCDFLQKHYPFLIGEFREILFHAQARSQYSADLITTVARLARRYGLEDRMRLCFSR